MWLLNDFSFAFLISVVDILFLNRGVVTVKHHNKQEQLKKIASPNNQDLKIKK